MSDKSWTTRARDWLYEMAALAGVAVVGGGAVGCVFAIWVLPIALATLVVVGILKLLGVL